MKVMLDMTVVFKKNEIFRSTEDLENLLGKFFASQGLTAEKMLNPTKLAIELSLGEKPTAKNPNPNASAKPQNHGDDSILMKLLATKPKKLQVLPDLK